MGSTDSRRWNIKGSDSKLIMNWNLENASPKGSFMVFRRFVLDTLAISSAAFE